MTIWKDTHVCSHSWCTTNVKVANTGGKFPAICRLCGEYTLQEELPDSQTIDHTEFVQLENRFRTREEEQSVREGKTS